MSRDRVLNVRTTRGALDVTLGLYESSGVDLRERRPVSGGGPGAALGEIIRRQRELSELSMRQFADMVGISNPYLSQIERGLREPSEKVLDAIARTLDVSTEALYTQAGLGADEEEAGEPPARAALREDPRLSPRQRQALIEIYDAFVAAGGAARPRRRRRPAARD